MKLSPLPLIVLCLFMGFTFWVMASAKQSLLALDVPLMSSPDTAQVVIAHYIMAALACAWLYQDARSRGKGLAYLVPFFIVTAVFVPAGPLLYLALRTEAPLAKINKPPQPTHSMRMQ